MTHWTPALVEERLAEAAFVLKRLRLVSLGMRDRLPVCLASTVRNGDG